MKQLLQNLGDGVTTLVDAPAPQVRAGQLLIETRHSLISTGTERMLVDFGKAGFIGKARSQPEKVKQVLDKMRTDGILTTVDAVRSKLGQPIPLGYSNVGVVRAVGRGVEGFSVGDRVLSNGPHADMVSVPANLCARIPDGVDDTAAAFTVVGSIGLQGIRLAEPTLGECFVVTGVGLIGLLTVQLLRAHGCRVLAIDFDANKLELARKYGAQTCNPGAGEDVLSAAAVFSRGQGVDGVIVTASTKSSDPISQAANMCRKRGRIILVGVTGLELNRAEFYEKELSFQVSCSYGPGRYDPSYEEGGNDYPVGFVRWTEQRNFIAVLDMMASGAVQTEDLVSKRFEFADAVSAYTMLTQDKGALGIMLDYSHPVEERAVSTVALSAGEGSGAGPVDAPQFGFIGAGNYASRMLIPAFRKAGAGMHTVASAGGTSGVVHGKKAGFRFATSDTDALLANEEIDAVAIATRHNTHASLTVRALEAGKHVFVEKPLCLTVEELDEVRQAHDASDRMLMVGFNRRFAPHIVRMKAALDKVAEPKVLMSVMNAGAIPGDHWTQDLDVGGGRIVGEACHHIDLLRFLAGSPIVSVDARRIAGDPSGINEDKAVILLGFEDGSFGTVHYLANGASSFPKERVEAFAAGRTMQMDNFVDLRPFGWPGVKRKKLLRQDKGQDGCAAAFMDAVRKAGPSPIPAEELFEVSRATLDAARILREQA